MFLNHFEGPSRLLARELLFDSNAALVLFKRLQRIDPDRCPLLDLLDTLCGAQIDSLDSKALTVGPLVWWFPAIFKRNLLSFLHLVPSLPPAVLKILQCLRQDPSPDPWVTTLSARLERNVDPECVRPLLSATCSSKVTRLLERLEGSSRSGPWTKLFNNEPVEPEPGSLSGSTRRKRKESCQEEEDSDGGQQSKRRRTDVIQVDGPEASTSQDGVGKSNLDSAPDPCHPDSCHDDLPEHMTALYLHLRELLDTEMEWDQNSVEVFKVLNDCVPMQIEALCHKLNLSEVTDRTLLKLCDGLPSLDLSYSSAVTLVRSLLLQRILTLSEPASRTLLTSMLSLCLRFTRPMCHAVIGPVLEDTDMGTHQAELLNQLVGNCLDSQYKLLLLQMMLKVTWSESSLSVLHGLLNSKVDVSAEVFGRLVEQLKAQSPPFIKSHTFAKMMLTVLTQYSSHVTAAHKNSLSSVLTLNKTFLKKSLEAALKRI